MSLVGFSTEILAQKLAKLNISQQSIETLSHWCVFHHRYCRQVVETWDSEFRKAPLERKICLLYLANDIIQNSKKDGLRYTNEFWKVIAAALNDVFTNCDDFGRIVVQRLVNIWETRKIFGTQGQLLKEDYDKKFEELKPKSKKPGGELVEKVISSYKHMLSSPIDEDTLMRKCNIALSFVDNLNKEYGNSYLGSTNGSGSVEELQEKHSILRNTIEQFKTSESLRATLISNLKEALHDQEFKMELLRNQLRAAQSRYKKADDLCQKLGICVERQEPSNKGLENSSLSEVPVTFVPDSANVDSLEKGQLTAVRYSQEGDGGKHEILTGVLSSRATSGNIEQKIEEHTSSSKRQKLENGLCVPQPESPPLPPPFPHPDTFEQPPPPPQYPPSPESSPPPPPPPLPPSLPRPIPLPPSMPPPIPPPPPPPPPTTNACMPVPAAPMAGMPYNVFPPFPPAVNYPMINMPPPFPGAPNPHPGSQGLRGPFYGPPFRSAPRR